jgi:hypothetical protein
MQYVNICVKRGYLHTYILAYIGKNISRITNKKQVTIVMIIASTEGE